MTAPNPPSIETRIAALEQQVRILAGRIAKLEEQPAGRSEHPVDTVSIREKVKFDWQA